MHQKEFDNIQRLLPFERYDYFIKKVADFEELWTITNSNGNYALSYVDENVMISFWPAKQFIISNLNNGWENCEPKRLTLDDLEKEIFEIIVSEHYLLNIFPINGKSGFVVDLDEFARDLNNELKKYH